MNGIDDLVTRTKADIQNADQDEYFLGILKKQLIRLGFDQVRLNVADIDYIVQTKNDQNVIQKNIQYRVRWESC
ncbi:hypothetical protein KPC_3801 [Acinetobacter stercoris]|uniref:Uncharacterized protein n=1 Tax=Acinetobacter stercoris TaxID=2126983 RepID=A0A2U3N4P6_9GAMM|nr:hypothetical protein KPC_3801 [Acinetobacter stercoris]